jgi:hypothetical protein
MSNEYYDEQMAKWEPVDVDESEDDGKDVSEEKSDVQTG